MQRGGGGGGGYIEFLYTHDTYVSHTHLNESRTPRL
jgi:hypothetical protein